MSLRLTCGDIFDFNNLDDPSNYVLEDIAHSLSQTPTYLGRGVKMNVSYAQKAFYLSWMVDPEKGRIALLRDSWVAYMGSIPSQIRNNVPALNEMKNKIQAAVALKFGFPVSAFDDEDIKGAYENLNTTLSTSILQYSITGAMTDGSMWNLDLSFHEWPWKAARKMFLDRYNKLSDPTMANEYYTETAASMK